MPRGKHAAPPAVTAASVLAAGAAAVVAVPVALAGAVTPPVAQADPPAGLDARVVQEVPPARPLVTRIISVSAQKTYTVVSGDTLSGIAGRFRMTWPELWHCNQAEVPDPDTIYPGQQLRLTCQQLAAVAQDAGVQAPGDPPAVPSPAPAAAPVAAVTGVSGGTLSCAGLEALWEAAGGSPAEAFMAAEIAMAESGGQQYALSPTDDYGYWQINASHGPAEATFDALGNARAAVAISGDGTNWSPWTTYTDNLYEGRC